MSNYTVKSYSYYNGEIAITLCDGSRITKPLSWLVGCPDMSNEASAQYSLRYSPRPCTKRIQDKLNQEAHYMDLHLRQLDLAEYERNQHYGFHSKEY